MLTFPILRSTDLIPFNSVLETVAQFEPGRAASFKVRVDNEDLLLEKAKERPLFGWGGWGRQRVYDENGRDISITDGTWIIRLGNGGWVNYIAIFGLLCWPAIGFFLRAREDIDPVSVGIVLILCAKLIDLIPNSVVGAVAWLSAGALIGRTETRLLSRRLQPGAGTSMPREYSYARNIRETSHYARMAPEMIEREHAEPQEKSSPKNQYSRLHAVGRHRK